MKTNVYYDYIDGEPKPLWMVLEFEEAIDMESDLYFDISSQYEKKESHDFDENIAAASVTLDDLVIPTFNTQQVGINLRMVKHRLSEEGYYTDHIQNLIVQVRDIEEILNSTQ